MLQILLICYGVYAMFRRRYRLIPGRTVTGIYARFAGFILVVAPVVSYQVSFYVAETMYRQSRLSDELQASIQLRIWGIDVAFFIGSIIVSALVASIAPFQFVEENEHSPRGKQKRKTIEKPKKHVGTYSVEEAAEILRMTPEAVLALIHDKKLAADWYDATYHIKWDVFQTYLTKHQQRKTASVDAPLPAALRTPIDAITPHMPASAPIAPVPPPTSAPAPTTAPAKAADLAKIAALTDAIAERPDDVTLVFSRGRAYFTAGLTGLAVLDFKRVLELEPNHPKATSMRNFIAQFGASQN